MKRTYYSLDFVLLLNIFLAAIVLGAIAHEAFHFLTISNPSELTVYWGNPDFVISTCCLEGDEGTMEAISYGVQFLVMGLWVLMNFKFALKKKSLD